MRALDRYRENKTVSEGPVPSEIHVRVVGLVDEMIGQMLGQKTVMTPIVRMMVRMRPALLADLATIPPDTLRTFMVDLGRRMVAAADPSVTVDLHGPVED